MLFNDIEQFLNYLRIEKSASQLTLNSYKTDLEQFCIFVADKQAVEINQITYEMVNHQTVREYLIHLQDGDYKRASIARKLAALRSLVKYLCKENKYSSNPIAAVSTPKQDKKLPQFLYPQEIELLLAAPDNSYLGIRDKAIMELLYATGMRVSELVGLNTKDIDLEQELVKVWGKGGKERIIPWGRAAKLSLINYLHNSRGFLARSNNASAEALFLNKNGTRLSDRSIRNILNKYVEKVAINQKISPHGIRHTFATHMLNNGADLRSVQELLGHVKLSTTQIYTHLTKEKIKTIHNNTHPRG